MEQRTVPGASRRLSALTVTVDPPSAVPPSSDARTVALLQRCRAKGVVTFDVGDARFPERAERLIAAAFPSTDPELGVIVARSVDSLAAEKGASAPEAPDLGAALAASVEQSRRRLGSVPVTMVEWRISSSGARIGDEPGEELPSAEPLDRETTLAVRIPPRGRLPALARRAGAVYSGDLSILDHDVESVLEPLAAEGPTAFLARNSLADGRLDGSRFAHSANLVGPGEGPIDLRRLHREFDPVLRLGFLTEGHRRTLAQAALRFVLIRPWVVSAVVPLPAPERLDELLGFESTPPLTREELERVYGLK